MQGEIRPGYKQTEVGVIPEDWDELPLGSLFNFKNGLNKAKEFFGHGTPIVNYMDVFNQSGLQSAVILGRVDVNRDELKAYEVRRGDVFFTRTSETVEEIGIASVMIGEVQDTVFSGFILRARPVDDSLDNEFKRYCFSAPYFRQQVTMRASYTTRALTNGRSLSAALIARPPLPEQRAIAAALSDADALMAALEAMIAKKRDLKQAAMQRLLTGKTRLPGFSGEWEVKRLGDVCRISTGKKDVNEGNPNGHYPFFTCARDHTFSDGFSFEGEAILIAGNGDVGNLSYFDGQFEAYQRTYVLQGFTSNVSYLWHQLSAFLVTSLGVGTIGSSIPYIKKENLLRFEFLAPPNPLEQTAISAPFR